MGSTQFGKFHDFCRDSTLPVCNLFVDKNQPPNEAFGGCPLTGITLSGNRNLGNLGSILLAFIAILTSLLLLWRSERKQAAVGRREIQLFLLGFIVIEICEIFSVGAFPLDAAVRKGFSAVHIAAITATCWVLLLNALVGYQFLDDGTPASLGLISASALVFFIGTGYIALDTGFNWTGEFKPDPSTEYRNIALYVLYQLFPLVCLVVFFVLEAVLVIRVLGESRPMLYLSGGLALCYRSDFRICHQHPHLSGHEREDQRCIVRDSVHPPISSYDLDLLEQYHRRRLAHANGANQRIQLDDSPQATCSLLQTEL